MIETASLVQLVALSAAAYMGSLYFLSLIRRDTSIVDVGWGLGFVTLALAIRLNLEDRPSQFCMVAALIAVWGLRLFLHILVRKAGTPEDWRYARWREQWGRNHWWRSLLQVFVLQGLLMLVIASPLYVAALSATGISISMLSIVGVVVWVIGFYFEAVGDYQLTKFMKEKAAKPVKKSKKKGKKVKTSEIMTSGLWKYTRHPNYFGEMTQWWGLWLVVLPLQHGVWAVVSPLTITFLLLKVSGVTMLEQRWEGNKDFEKYKKRTSAIIPLPPRDAK